IKNMTVTIYKSTFLKSMNDKITIIKNKKIIIIPITKIEEETIDFSYFLSSIINLKMASYRQNEKKGRAKLTITVNKSASPYSPVVKYIVNIGTAINCINLLPIFPIPNIRVFLKSFTILFIIQSRSIFHILIVVTVHWTFF